MNPSKILQNIKFIRQFIILLSQKTEMSLNFNEQNKHLASTFCGTQIIQGSTRQFSRLDQKSSTLFEKENQKSRSSQSPFKRTGTGQANYSKNMLGVQSNMKKDLVALRNEHCQLKKKYQQLLKAFHELKQEKLKLQRVNKEYYYKLQRYEIKVSTLNTNIFDMGNSITSADGMQPFDQIGDLSVIPRTSFQQSKHQIINISKLKNHNFMIDKKQEKTCQSISYMSKNQQLEKQNRKLKQQLKNLENFINKRQKIQISRHESIAKLKDTLSDF